MFPPRILYMQGIAAWWPCAAQCDIKFEDINGVVHDMTVDSYSLAYVDHKFRGKQYWALYTMQGEEGHFYKAVKFWDETKYCVVDATMPEDEPEYIWQCNECMKTFDEPKVVHTTYEAIYDAPVDSHTAVDIMVYQYCGDEDIEEVEVNAKPDID